MLDSTNAETAMAAGGGFQPPPGGYSPQPGGFGGVPPGAPGGFGGPYQAGPYQQHPNPYFPQPPPPASGPSGLSIAALVLGLGSMMTTCFPMGIVGLWLGARARKAAQERGERSGSPDDMMALIGMIISGVFGGLWGLYWLFNLALILLGFGAAFLPIVFG